MRILHLAYEDPMQPGAGGGSLRTYEVNRRLSERHDITCIVSGYPQATERVEDNVRYIPVGSNTGTKADRVTYFASLPNVLRKHRDYDLIVEDFSAPISTAFVPLMTDIPVVASIQWLFAKEMSHKYHLPFDLVEQGGIRYYDDFIVLSDWLGDKVKELRPEATIEKIYSGIEDDYMSVEPAPPEYLAFIGRMDITQKGIDLLLESYRALCDLLGESTPPLHMAGEGPDKNEVSRLIQQHGLEDKVKLVGWLSGNEKFEFISRAYAMLMPSRFETFGIVSVEAQSVGTPVVIYDVGPLPEVCGPGGGLIAPAFDTDAYAALVADLIQHDMKRQALIQQGREWARAFTWDRTAEQQEAHYLRAVNA